MRRSLNRFILLPVVALMLAGFGGLAREFAPDAELWAKWEAHDPASEVTVDHAVWGHFLDRFVVDQPGPNTVRYAHVTRDEDLVELEGYLQTLSETEVSALARPEQFAYWVNMYNALTVKVVLDAWPVESIRDIDISPGFFADGPWDKKLITVEGEELSLNDIEHRILRPIWDDPRIHYVVNCAAIGCPDLQPTPFTADGLEEALEATARSYVNDPRGVSFDNGRLVVSSIYDWFYEDFGTTDGALIAHLKRYADPDLAARLDENMQIVDARYDWSINRAE